MRTAIGIDAVEITPHGADGYTHINVIVNLFTKFVSLHPVKGCTALNLSNSVWKHWCNFGHTDMIISDQGPDLTSNMFEQLTSYMGMQHTFSIADKHANGCERLIGEVVRHLRAMAYDHSRNKQCLDVFADPSWIDSAQYILNSEISSETGHSPFELTYGTHALPYMAMAKGELSQHVHARLSKMNADLMELKHKSQLYQQTLMADRKGKGVDPYLQNTYQPSDLVLFDKGPKVHPKMFHRYLGPYEVINQTSNDVFCRQLATGESRKFDVSDLRLYAGSREDAFDMACRDQDQHVIDVITSVKGDLRKRTTLIFSVKFMDGDVKEVPYSLDLFQSIPYEEFCRSKPYTRHLIRPAGEAVTFIADIERTNLVGYTPGQEVYLDLRCFGDVWFRSLNLPDSDTTTYVSTYEITEIARRHLTMVNRLHNDTRRFRPYPIYCYLHTEFDSDNMVLIDEAFLVLYPHIILE
jgi:hypothetical protein